MDALNIVSAENLEGRIDVSRALGSTETLMFIYDLAPGASSSPYHYEYDEEWLLVVEGTVVLRAPDGEHTLERGDLVRFPRGPEGAHKVMNRSESPARTMSVLEQARAGGLGLPGQRHSRRLGRRRERPGLPARDVSALVARRRRLGEAD